MVAQLVGCCLCIAYHPSRPRTIFRPVPTYLGTDMGEELTLAHNFTAWLYQPYLNLGSAADTSPLHCYGPEIAFLNAYRYANLPEIQALLPATFRKELWIAAGYGEWLSENELSQPEPLRSNDWDWLIKRVSGFAGDTINDQVLTLQLLNKLCLYKTAADLSREIPERSIDEPYVAEGAYYRYVALQSLKDCAFIGHFSLDSYAELFERADKKSVAALHASYQMVLANIKYKYDVEQAQYWCDQHQRVLEAEDLDVNDFDYARFRSRFYRVLGFIPQMKGEREQCSKIMQRAEDLARDVSRHIPTDTPTEYARHFSAACQEILYPVLESRTKEGLWSGDLQLALAKATEAINMCPADPRLFLHHGEVLAALDRIEEASDSYLNSYLVGPPCQSLAAYMYAQCQQILGNAKQAAIFFKISSSIDPLALSPIEGLQDCFEERTSPRDDFPSLAIYVSENRLQEGCAVVGNQVKAYQGSQFEERA